MRNCK